MQRKWLSYGCSKEFVQSAALHSNDWTGENCSHQDVVTGGNNIDREGAGLARSLVVRVHAGESSFEVTSERRAEQRRDEPWLVGKAGAGSSRSSTTLQKSFARFTAK